MSVRVEATPRACILFFLLASSNLFRLVLPLKSLWNRRSFLGRIPFVFLIRFRRRPSFAVFYAVHYVSCPQRARYRVASDVLEESIGLRLSRITLDVGHHVQVNLEERALLTRKQQVNK